MSEFRFDWDPQKAAENLRKHGVSFEEAATAVAHPLASTNFDSEHSEHEDREKTFGYSVRQRLLFVGHTRRGSVIRIITARRATRTEEREYERGF